MRAAASRGAGRRVSGQDRRRPPTTRRASRRCSTRPTSRSSSGVFGAAWTCADRAADLAPTSVEAHHLRGAALAALGRDAEAQTAYALALALDPDDPETLRAVADFYINGKGERGRDALRLGLELAQRGSRRALRAPPPQRAARRRPRGARGAGAQRSRSQRRGARARRRRAADRARAAATRCTRRASRCSTCRGSPTRRPRFRRRSAIQPDDAYTHQMLGLTLEQLGDPPPPTPSCARAVDARADRAVAAGPDLEAPSSRRRSMRCVATLPPERRARVQADQGRDRGPARSRRTSKAVDAAVPADDPRPVSRPGRARAGARRRAAVDRAVSQEPRARGEDARRADRADPRHAAARDRAPRGSRRGRPAPPRHGVGARRHAGWATMPSMADGKGLATSAPRRRCSRSSPRCAASRRRSRWSRRSAARCRPSATSTRCCA